ncbi:MAG: tetratricopeptide repeat protein [Alphaproteobacteria bacterium]
MSIKYFEYIVVIVSGCLLFIPILLWRLNIRLRYLQKLTRINVLKRQQLNEKNVLFSSDILNFAIRKLYFSRQASARLALVFAIGGRIAKAADFFAESQPMLALLLRAHENAEPVYKKIVRQKKLWLNSPQYGIYLPILAHLLFDHKTLMQNINKFDAKSIGKYDRKIAAYYHYIAACAHLFDGNMLSASQSASSALKAFQKFKYSAEEAATYLLLAEIYRISCVNDIAHTMLEAALKIYKAQNLKLLYAKTVAAWGMLLLFENRHDEAEQKYIQALSLSPVQTLKADVCNQLSLFYIVRNNLNKALDFARRAFDINTTFKNRFGEAFSNQLLGQIAFQKKQYTKSRQHLKYAADLYFKQNNFSAYAECLYLISESHYKQNQYAGAEKLLRQILDIKQQQNINFHTANAYSLLGLIYLQTGDYQRAKVLFQQSLHLEQNHERCEGLLVDYANLALIDELCGNKPAAQSNLQIALEYAKKTENNDLIRLIENKLKPLT